MYVALIYWISPLHTFWCYWCVKIFHTNPVNSNCVSISFLNLIFTHIVKCDMVRYMISRKVVPLIECPILHYIFIWISYEVYPVSICTLHFIWSSINLATHIVKDKIDMMPTSGACLLGQYSLLMKSYICILHISSHLHQAPNANLICSHWFYSIYHFYVYVL